MHIFPNSAGEPELNAVILEMWSDSARASSASVRSGRSSNKSTAKGPGRQTRPASSPGIAGRRAVTPAPQSNLSLNKAGSTAFGASIKQTIANKAARDKANAANIAKNVGNAVKAGKTAVTNYQKDLAGVQKGKDAATKAAAAAALKASKAAASAPLAPALAAQWHTLNDQIMNMSSQLTQLDAAGRNNSPLFAVMQQKINDLTTARNTIDNRVSKTTGKQIAPTRPATMGAYVKPKLNVSHVVVTHLHHNIPTGGSIKSPAGRSTFRYGRTHAAKSSGGKSVPKGKVR